jgi:hypothetical protein
LIFVRIIPHNNTDNILQAPQLRVAPVKYFLQAQFIFTFIATIKESDETSAEKQHRTFGNLKVDWKIFLDHGSETPLL